MEERLRILFVADIFGSAGRSVIADLWPELRERTAPDFAIANCENAAGGFGFTPAIAEDLFRQGFDVLTGGNHSWDRKESLSYLEMEPRVLRPANYPEGAPGRGWGIYRSKKGKRVAVLNLMGRVFMDSCDCPFQAATAILPDLERETPLIFVDMHAETTSEKTAMGYHLDGRVSAVVGTHTHVQTADERILSKGTAYITDAGMTGPHDSVIGVKSELILRRFLTKLPVRFEASKKDPRLSGVLVDVDGESGQALHVERIHLPGPSGRGGGGNR